MVVHGEDGLDEISISGRTKVSRFKDGKVENFYIEPEDFGIWKNKIDHICGAAIRKTMQLSLFRFLKAKKGRGGI